MSRIVYYAKVKEDQAEFPQNLSRCFTSNASTSASLVKELNDKGLAPSGSNIYLKVPTTDAAGPPRWMQLGIPGSPEIPSDSSELQVIIEKPEGVAGQVAVATGAAAGLGVGNAAGAGAAAGLAVGSTAGAGSAMLNSRYISRMEAGGTKDSNALLHKPKSFSSVSKTDANNFVAKLKIMEVNGNALYPVDCPADTPECSSFVWDPYPNEDLATTSILEHHQKQLELLKVPFGKSGGFDMYNVHKSSALQISYGSQAYRGIFDGCVAPFGLFPNSALLQCRIAYENKTPQKLQQCAGQAVIELLATFAYAPCPVLLDLTDGNRHDVYTIKDKEMIVWRKLKPTQAYYLQAQHLIAEPLRAQRTLELEDIPEDQQAWMRPLHQLRPVSELQEQLDSVIPFLPPDERMLTALELIHAWTQGQPEVLGPPPAGIQDFYS